MSDVKIKAEQFFQRLERLQTFLQEKKSTLWQGSDAVSIVLGTSDDATVYSKSASLHLFLFGYEFPDTIIVIMKGHFYFMGTKKKNDILQKELAPGQAASSIQLHFLEKSKDEGQNRESFHDLLNSARKLAGAGKKMGLLTKEKQQGAFAASWLSMIEQSTDFTIVDTATAFGAFLAVKDDTEVELCKRAAILTNKVMKHGFVSEMEDLLDNGKKCTHEKMAENIENVILNAPEKLQLKIAADAIDCCFSPIVQSGGKYDTKVSAVSNEENMRADIIICSLGARYKGYCANVSRTYLVDVPNKVEKTYSTLLAVFSHCLEKMVPGNSLKDVLISARTFLTKRDASLVPYLSKSLGFSMGLEFRDGSLLLNDKNETLFVDGMIFTLTVAFTGVPLTAEDRKGSTGEAAKLETYALMVGDTVRVQKDGAADVLTKCTKEYSDISYNISGDDDESDSMSVDKEKDSAKADAAKPRERRNEAEKLQSEQSAFVRGQQQAELMKKKLAEKVRLLEAGGGAEVAKEEEEMQVTEPKTYPNTESYPRDAAPNQIRVDLEKEALLVPISGQPVPFHISCIKAVSMPEPDRCTYLRITFYVPGAALGKDVNKNMAGLVVKHGDRATFIKELTFRSQSQRNLAQVYQQFSELRKRVKQREQKAEQEKDLVVQQKLVRIKDQRVPRLQDLTMRPSLSGRKCVGTIEAHQNGLRFTSTKYENLDILYSNIKHAIYQPCDPTTAIVLVHFHLKDFIMIGKKKHKDVQFFTEVVDASLSLDNSKRSSYDPDELDEEQREREARRRLNGAFKDFCQKLEKVASHYDFPLNIDIPFRKSGFEANINREMVLVQPTTHALVNLTESPAFVVTISEIEHVHFERAGFSTKAFDIVIIFKNWETPPKQLTAIDVKNMDIVQEWLNLVEITYTMGGNTGLNWVNIMEAAKEDDRFYYDTDHDGIKKPAGWKFLALEDSEEEDGADDEDEESSYSESDDDDSSSESDDDSDDESDFSEDDEDDEDDDESDDGEPAKDWDELEKEAAASDRAKRSYEDDEPAKGRKPQGRGPPEKKAKR